MILSKYFKRALVIFVGFSVSAFIWHVNRNIFNNTILICLILSTTTFLLIYTPFEIYFSIRDLWYDRFPKLKVKDLETNKIKIQVDKTKPKNGYIIANLIKKKEIKNNNSKNTIIIINHGYSDTKETLEYLYLPIALQGYVILTYDARGSGESKKLGKRNHLLERIQDYQKIINWIHTNENFQDYEIISIGFSIGAVIAISGSFEDERVKKIIAISAISHYKKNVRTVNPIILISYLLRGIKLFPNKKLNKQISPYLIFQKKKKSLSSEKFHQLSERVYLIHSKNDRVINFENFMRNANILDLPKHNKLVFRKGGHTLKKNEVSLVGGILDFILN